jgi:16S rRNA C1402 N4-methylase RsmH
VAKRAVIAGDEEVDLNPRSRSAKLRAIEKEID